MKKAHPKWFQEEAVLTSSIQNNDEQSNSIIEPKIQEQSSSELKQIHDENIESIESDEKDEKDSIQSLKEIFLDDLYKFKEEGLYDEALACIQSIFEVQGVDIDLLYEAAEIYFLMNDYRRAANCLKNFLEVKPNNCRGHLLKTQILLQIGNKENALSTIQNFFKQRIKITSPEEYATLDQIIEKLKKNFKADKLFRRCPQILDYQKKRRQMLKTAKNQQLADENKPINKSQNEQVVSNSTDSIDSTNVTNSTISNTSNTPKENSTIMNSTINTQNTQAQTIDSPSVPTIDTKLFDTIYHIWDMQSATSEEKVFIISTSKEDIHQAILKQVLSYKKKLWLYNYCANIFFQETDNTTSKSNKPNLDTAIYLLRQALLLDDENDLLLKNLGYLLYKKGELSAAKVVFEDIHTKDFATEEFIKLCQISK